MNRINIGEAVSFAWSAYAARWRLFTGVLGAMFGAWVVLEIVVVATQRLGIIAWALAHVAFLLSFAGIEAGLLRISLALQDGREPTLADAFKHFTMGPRLLAGQLLYLAVVLAGLVLLVVPGVVVAARLAFFGFETASGGNGVFRSFSQSAKITRRASGRLAVAMIVLVLFNLLGAALLGLGLLVSVPLSLLTLTSINCQLSAREPSA